MPMPNYPTIVVPGITAVYLEDMYPAAPETIWSVMTRDYERAALHPDNLALEAQEPADIVPGRAFEVAYKELIEELRYNLRSKADEAVPVFAFRYDWRQPLATTQRQLGEFIDLVIERTKLLRHFDRQGYTDDPKVNLVGHSMGGLVIAGYLESVGRNHKVDKVATLATPFQGSFEAVIKITTGTADLGESAPSSREREAARLTPALYQLLPSFANAVTADQGLPTSLFDPDLWQPSIVDTIAEYVRLHGLGRGNRTAQRQQANDLFAALLKGGNDFSTRLTGMTLANVGMTPDRWLCVAGVDSTTRVKLKVVKKGRAPDFQFASADRQNEWGNADQNLRRLTGDGTVPFQGAIPQFMNVNNLVCVAPDDFGYWEVQDKVLAAASGFHGLLPNMDMLHRLIVAHFSGQPDRHGNIWGRLPPGVTKANWAPAIPKLLNK